MIVNDLGEGGGSTTLLEIYHGLVDGMAMHGPLDDHGFVYCFDYQTNGAIHVHV